MVSFSRGAKIIFLLLLNLVFASQILFATSLGVLNNIEYGIADSVWEESLGSCRAIVDVDASGDYKVVIPWRLKNYPGSNIILEELSTNKILSTVSRGTYDDHFGTIYFNAPASGKYAIYYLPYKPSVTHGSYRGGYTPYLSSSYSPSATAKEVAVSKIEYRTLYDNFFPMQIVATKKEVASLISKSTSNEANKDYFIFCEDRTAPVALRKSIPLKWALEGTSNSISLKARPNEYYAFQIALLPLASNLTNLRVNYLNLPSKIKATCFNLEGTDYKGNYFTKTVNAKKDEVLPLWFGLDIPSDIQASSYNFEVELSFSQGSSKKVSVNLNVEGAVLADRGDSNPYLHSRLRWLNSTLGHEEVLIKPFTKVDFSSVGGVPTISLLNKKIELSELGFFKQIKVANSNREVDLLSSPMALLPVVKKDSYSCLKSATTIDNKLETYVAWKTLSQFDAFDMEVSGKVEFDSHCHFDVSYTFKKNSSFKDIALSIPFNLDNALHIMGMGASSQDLPCSIKSKWRRGEDSFWVGSANAGLHTELLGTYNGPLIKHYAPPYPKVWYNNNKGGFSLKKSQTQAMALVSSGSQSYKAGEKVTFSFNMIITPAKEVDTKSHFSYRYFHNPILENAPFDKGVNVINIHHANPYNPYINYPFLTPDNSKKIVKAVHEKGAKVKFYYTVREVSAILPEIYALMALDGEIIAPGRGGGFVYLKEHLEDNYQVAWYAHNGGFFDGVDSLNPTKECEGLIPDAAVVMNINSRWYNYYVEGLKWILQNYDLDGLYLDDVAFDSTIVKRMRRVMDSIKPGCLIDLHSNTGFSGGPAIQYTDFFPYIDRLWFGESFYYNLMNPTAYLVESSGIPFGLMGEMLFKGGNLWKGMVYGMTNRYGWVTEGVKCDPSSVWELFDKVDIATTQMIGYWDEAMAINSSNKNVKATIYVSKDSKTILLVGANFSGSNAKVSFNAIDEKIDLSSYNVTLPEVRGMQREASYSDPLDKLSFRLKAHSGVAIILTKK